MRPYCRQWNRLAAQCPLHCDASALEHHVLDKMRDAVPLGILVAGAGFDPDADRNRADVLHLFGDNRETIRQHFTPDMSYIVNHENSPSRPAENRSRSYCDTARGDALALDYDIYFQLLRVNATTVGTLPRYPVQITVA